MVFTEKIIIHLLYRKSYLCFRLQRFLFFLIKRVFFLFGTHTMEALDNRLFIFVSIFGVTLPLLWIFLDNPFNCFFKACCSFDFILFLLSINFLSFLRKAGLFTLFISFRIFCLFFSSRIFFSFFCFFKQIELLRAFLAFNNVCLTSSTSSSLKIVKNSSNLLTNVLSI